MAWHVNTLRPISRCTKNPAKVLIARTQTHTLESETRDNDEIMPKYVNDLQIELHANVHPHTKQHKHEGTWHGLV